MSGLQIHHKRSFRFGWLFTALLVIALVVCSWYAYRWYTVGAPLPFVPPITSAQPKLDQSGLSVDDIDGFTVAANQPRYMSIPALGVDKARIIPVDVDSNGQLANPKNINDAAWYQNSATPGIGYGAVLIDNHVGGCADGGVFQKVGDLKPGDTIAIERGDGRKFTYSLVASIKQALRDVTQDTTKQLLSSVDTDKEGLSLISCAGNWIPKYQQFDQQIVLRAVLVD